MEKQSRFSPEILKKLAKTFAMHKVDYIIIGKGGAILYGYYGVTYDIDIFPKKDLENGKRIVKALREIGFKISRDIEKEIIRGKDFIQIREGPFDIDIVFAPDGIESFKKAKSRYVLIDGKYPVASLKDIIKSKEEAGRKKDMKEVEDLKEFARYLEARKELKSAKEIRKG